MLVGLEIAQNTCAMFVMFRKFNFQVLADNCMHFVEEKLTVLGEMKQKLVLEQQIDLNADDFGKMKDIKIIKEATTIMKHDLIAVRNDKFDNISGDLIKIIKKAIFFIILRYTNFISNFVSPNILGNSKNFKHIKNNLLFINQKPFSSTIFQINIHIMHTDTLFSKEEMY